MHDVENCCSFLYIGLSLFKYIKFSAVFFYIDLILSLEMSDEPKISPADLPFPSVVDFQFTEDTEGLEKEP